MSPISYFSFSQTPTSKASRRCPLSPPAVSAPTVAPFSSLPALHRSFSSPKATILLTRVALASRANSNSGSTTNSPSEKTHSGQENQKVFRPYAEKALEREMKADDWRFWQDKSRRDGYISFPDFEQYCSPHDLSQESSQNQQSQRSSLGT